MTPARREELRSLVLIQLQIEDIRNLAMDIADGHCHLVDCFKKFKATTQARSWRRMEEEHVSADVGRVTDVVDNYVFPNSWSKRVHIPNVRIHRCVGAHPRMVNTHIPWGFLRQLMAEDDCVAIGECGLDATVPDLAEQKKLLEAQAELAKAIGKPLVLHVRGRRLQDVDDMFRETLACLSQLDRLHPVYLHSYTGSWETAVEWRSRFPHLIYSLSWKTTESVEFTRLAAHLPLECIAFESDGPHLSPSGIRSGHNSPFTIWLTAEKMAAFRHLPIAVLLDISRRNVAKFFGF